VAYLGGARCDAPLWPDHENFLQATLYHKVRFFAIFQQELQNSTMFDDLLRFQISEKWANLRFPLKQRSKKYFSFRGASPPDPPTRGSVPGPHWGLRPQTPVIGSRSARSSWLRLCQILNTPLRVTPRLDLIEFRQFGVINTI